MQSLNDISEDGEEIGLLQISEALVADVQEYLSTDLISKVISSSSLEPPCIYALLDAGPSIFANLCGNALHFDLDLSDLRVLMVLSWIEVRRPDLFSSMLQNPSLTFSFAGNPSLLLVLAPAAVPSRLRHLRLAPMPALEAELQDLSLEVLGRYVKDPSARPSWPLKASDLARVVEELVSFPVPEAYPVLKSVVWAARLRADAGLTPEGMGLVECIELLGADAGRGTALNGASELLLRWAPSLRLEALDTRGGLDALRRLVDKAQLARPLSAASFGMLVQSVQGVASLVDLHRIQDCSIALAYDGDESRLSALAPTLSALTTLRVKATQGIKPQTTAPLGLFGGPAAGLYNGQARSPVPAIATPPPEDGPGPLLPPSLPSLLPSLMELSLDLTLVTSNGWDPAMTALARLPPSATALTLLLGPLSKGAPPPGPEGRLPPLCFLSAVTNLRRLDLGKGPPQEDGPRAMAHLALPEDFVFLSSLSALTALTLLRTPNAFIPPPPSDSDAAAADATWDIPSLRRLSVAVGSGLDRVAGALGRHLVELAAEDTSDFPGPPEPNWIDLSSMKALREFRLTCRRGTHIDAYSFVLPRRCRRLHLLLGAPGRPAVEGPAPTGSSCFGRIASLQPGSLRALHVGVAEASPIGPAGPLPRPEIADVLRFLRDQSMLKHLSLSVGLTASGLRPTEEVVEPILSKAAATFPRFRDLAVTLVGPGARADPYWAAAGAGAARGQWDAPRNLPARSLPSLPGSALDGIDEESIGDPMDGANESLSDGVGGNPALRSRASVSASVAHRMSSQIRAALCTTHPRMSVTVTATSL